MLAGTRRYARLRWAMVGLRSACDHTLCIAGERRRRFGYPLSKHVYYRTHKRYSYRYPFNSVLTTVSRVSTAGSLPSVGSRRASQLVQSRLPPATDRIIRPARNPINSRRKKIIHDQASPRSFHRKGGTRCYGGINLRFAGAHLLTFGRNLLSSGTCEASSPRRLM
jgi:hypothetical protein